MERCRMTGEVTARVGEVFRGVRDVGQGEGRVYRTGGRRDSEVGVIGCRDGSTLREVG